MAFKGYALQNKEDNLIVHNGIIAFNNIESALDKKQILEGWHRMKGIKILKVKIEVIDEV